MKVQTCCPCCGETAITLREKLTLSRYSAYQCRSCGASLGVEQTGTGWFFVGWIPFSISGLFTLPLKVVLGCVGIGLIMFPHIYLIPLVEKSGEIGKKLPRWLLPWLAMLAIGTFASDWINLLPSNGTKIIVLLASVILTIPVIREVWRHIPKAEEKILAFVVFIVLVVCIHYFALSSLPPALLTSIAGEQRVVDAKVINKTHSNKLTRCSNKIEILISGEDQKQKICIPEESWKSIKNDDRILVTSLNTDYGRLVTTVAPSTRGDYDTTGSENARTSN